MQSSHNIIARRLHVGLIMDGNRRWAQARGQSPNSGYQAGAKAVRRVVEAAPGLGVGTLTLHAFSSDNWRRPPEQVAALMALFTRYLVDERPRCREQGVRVEVIGRRDRFEPSLLREIETTELATADGDRLLLRIAVDYSARDAILAAARWQAETRADFAAALAEVTHARTVAPDLDLLVRTSGEQRLSDFLLWETAYAELLFWGGFWPDFGAAELGLAVDAFRARDRRYGGDRSPTLGYVGA